jgi:xylulokinase
VGRASGANATLGSSAWISVASTEPLRDPEMRLMTFDHVIPGHYVPLGTMQAGGASLDWVAEVLGVTNAAELDALMLAAGDVEAAAEGLYFLPYLLGERSPIWDSSARGTFLGLSRHHGRAHLARAVLEGVAFNLATILFALREIAGEIDVIDAIGGGARSGTWLRIMADTWGVTIRRRSLTDEANSLGAAVVGGVAVGLIDDWGVAGGLSEVTETIEPVDSAHQSARLQHARFVDAYDRVNQWYRLGVSSADA